MRGVSTDGPAAGTRAALPGLGQTPLVPHPSAVPHPSSGTSLPTGNEDMRSDEECNQEAGPALTSRLQGQRVGLGLQRGQETA